MAAQAARLNLRMQKELKLLLTDPPPGSSFPSLSSAPSLSYIEAQIQGPEGTVYANGVFKLKIQIPDRYPFQPPMVTFATPIYHPNIDNGGRICLDILNLPPKGAWQPSLNISTVLTSIGLLLSEPNPDDGLMHEASQEYKYNRQAFDQKARSMTEKYARIDANEIANGGQCSQTLLKPSAELAEAKGTDTLVKENRVNEYEISHKRLCGISRKLSLDSSELDHRCNEGKGVNQVASMLLYEEQMELKGLKKDSELTVNDHNQPHEEPKRTRKKLPLESSVSLHVKLDNDMIDLVSNQCSSTSKPQSLMAFSNSWPLEQPALSSQQRPNKDDDGKSKANSIETQLKKKELLLSLDSSQKTGDDDENLRTRFQSCMSQEDFPLPQTIRHIAREPDCEIFNGDGNGSTRVKHKRLGLVGRKVSLGTLGLYQNERKDNIENLAPDTSFSVAQPSKNPTSSSSLSVASESGYCYERDAENYTTYFGYLNNSNNTKNQCQMQSMEPSKVATSQYDSCHGDKQQPKQDWPVDYIKPEETFPTADADSVIVLDSEDSDEEQGRVAKPKQSFARRRLLGKSKSSVQ